MKKTYMIPAQRVAEIEGADGILLDVSGGNSLEGTGNGGTTGEGGVENADVKEQRGSLWGNEW